MYIQESHVKKYRLFKAITHEYTGLWFLQLEHGYKTRRQNERIKIRITTLLDFRKAIFRIKDGMMKMIKIDEKQL